VRTAYTSLVHFSSKYKSISVQVTMLYNWQDMKNFVNKFQ